MYFLKEWLLHFWTIYCKDYTTRTIETTTYLTPTIQTQQRRNMLVVTLLQPQQALRHAIEP